jgi:hypothetical protein
MTAETVTDAGEQDETAQSPPPGLRAYLPNRRFARDLCTGSAALVARGFGWMVADGIREAGIRLGYTAGACYVGAYLAEHYTPIAMPGLVIGWCGAALAHAKPPSPPPGRTDRPEGSRRIDFTKRPAADIQADSGTEAEEEPLLNVEDDQEEPDLDTVTALIRRLADRGPDQRPHQGAHLDDLIDTGELGDWDKDTLKDALEEWGISVEEGGFKLTLGGRQRVRQGVRLRDLPAGAGQAPAPLPTGAREGAPTTPTQHPAAAPADTPPEAAAEAAPAPSPRSAPPPSLGAR